MAIDPNSKGQPNKVTPARDHAPAGTVNTSIAASGGQEYEGDDVDPTPSMQPNVRGSSETWAGPTGKTAGSPPAE